MSRPFLWAAVAFGAGAALGGSASRAQALLLVGFAVVLTLIAYICPHGRLACAALVGASVAAGAAAAAAERRSYETTPLYHWTRAQAGTEDPVLISGSLAEDAVMIGARWMLVVDVNAVHAAAARHDIPGRARVYVGGAAPLPDVVFGDHLSLWVRLRSPRGFENPGSFDTAAYARRRRFHALGHCKSALMIKRDERQSVAGVAGALAGLRRWSRERLHRFVGGGQEGALVRAMVLGDRTGLEPETEESFRIAGTYHILAISGAQVALVAGLLIWVLRRARAGPAVTAVIVCPMIALYAAFVGGDIPVTRAAVMAIVLILGLSVDLEADAANLLGLAALLVIVSHPGSVGDVGFQLSFAATLALIRLTPPIARILGRLPRWLRLPLATSLAAQIGVTPLLVVHFHRLAPAAVALNLIAVPLASAVLLAGVAVLAVAALMPALAPLAGWLAKAAAWLLLHTGSIGGVGSIWDIRVPSPGLVVWMIYAAGIIGLAVTRYGGRALGLLGLATAWLSLGPATARGDGRLHLTVLDVGHGDSLVIRTPRGRIWIVDAGTGASEYTRDMGEAVVAPFLWRIGARRADRLFLSHAHFDHVGGASYLSRVFPIEEAWEGPAPRDDPNYSTIARDLEQRRVGRRGVCRGMEEIRDGIRIEVVWPPCRRTTVDTARNDDSLVLRLTYGEIVLLLTGDVESAAERAMAVGAADVIKVPHHGSRSSSSFELVEAVRPRVAIVSVGRGRWRGHPDREILKRYERRGASVYRTDHDGAVTVVTDGERIWLRTRARNHSEHIMRIRRN
ncbi:MAG: DNA internalization-related competence protein ComEC/Rec2 [Vicinamibacteria bacterium]|nr:DNA internalization-related competence protein ComEC/Rec2 [Vicinamibacteria bacterium]